MLVVVCAHMRTLLIPCAAAALKVSSTIRAPERSPAAMQQQSASKQHADSPATCQWHAIWRQLQASTDGHNATLEPTQSRLKHMGKLLTKELLLLISLPCAAKVTATTAADATGVL
jgi:hypothetical protein